MECCDIKYLHKLFIGAKIIGRGQTAICFLLNNGKVFKLFHDIDEVKNEIKEDIISNFEDINSISNDTFIGPDTLIFKNGNLIGYTYDYLPGKTLKKLKNTLLVSDILNNYDYLIENTKDISDNKFILRDLHSRNILLGNHFHIIDLDRGEKTSEFDCKTSFKINTHAINEALVYALFNADKNKIIEFSDPLISDLFHNISDVNAFKELMNIFLEKYSDATSKSLRRKIDYKIYPNDWH